ncbi:MAG: T9SS type A sorting domain-containing protein, partial [Bacteroidetes bacterium]|nr:T9SS type A sorting domain-containing protein [Bacteroidota bacterium]
DAPDLTIKEYAKEILIYVTNSPSSNNYNETYKELDPQIRALTPDSLLGTPYEYDAYFHFEGYQIFQLRDATVTLAESRYDANKVRLVAQYDIRNGIGKLVNYKYDRAIGGNVPIIEVDGGDNGISHSFRLTEDAFATGDRALVNNKHYYYSAIAYGYNNYKTYDPTDPTALDGQKQPYLEGRKNIQLYTGIPHIPVNGIIANSTFGDGPKIKRIEGQGNGGQVLEISDETVEEILSKPPAGLTANGDTIKYGDPNYPIAYNPVYKEGHGPVNIQVIDPLNVKNSTYSLKFDTVWIWYTFQNVVGAEEVEAGGDTAGVRGVEKWYLIENETGKKYVSDVATTQNFEQLFPEVGISVNFGPVFYPGIYKIGEKKEVGPSGTDFLPVNNIIADNNGLLTSSIEYADSSRQWLDGVSDFDGAGSFNWIRSGTNFNQTVDDDWQSQLYTHDPIEAYEKILFGTFAPYFMCATDDQDVNGPALNSLSKAKSKGLRDIASIDLVLTPDKSKWTHCPVIEMSSEPVLAENGAERFFLRRSPSVDKDGNPSGWPAETEASFNPNDPNYVMAYGMGWFPGYAINLETGERLNMMFGEDSWLAGENGRDMLFNPSANIFSIPAGNILFGGKHYVYIMGSSEIDDTFGSGINIKYSFPAYDAGYAIATAIDTLPPGLEIVYMRYIYSTAMYTGIPLSVVNQEWLSNEVKIKIRISKPHEKYYSQPLSNEGSMNNHFPMYEFSTASIATTFLNKEKSISDLDLIKVVPNPYYAFAVGSGYEEVPLQNKVKITNLPEKCTISIYNISGTLIRKLTKDSPVTYIDWDLKNHAGIPIAGGVYIVHVKDHTTNEERIVKWFGSLRVEDFKEF